MTSTAASNLSWIGLGLASAMKTATERGYPVCVRYGQANEVEVRIENMVMVVQIVAQLLEGGLRKLKSPAPLHGWLRFGKGTIKGWLRKTSNPGYVATLLAPHKNKFQVLCFTCCLSLAILVSLV